MAKKPSLKSNWIRQEISNLKRDGLFINIRTIESPIDAVIKVEGKKVLNFCSNNYLGLANNPQIKKATIKAIDRYGIGPAAVRTISGTTQLHRQLEKMLKKFKKVEDVITMQSGFAANLAVIPALTEKEDFIFSDELNHASIIDACRLSKAQVIRYKHRDTNDLAKVIKKAKTGKKLIVTDGVFSMDGDIAPLDKLYQIAKKHNALLMVDDAHGEGVLGKKGRGIVDHFNLHGKVDIEVGTMSKAFGVIGGYIAARAEIIAWLKQRARPFLFSSAMTIPDTAACLEAVKIIQKSDKLVKKLWENTNIFKKELNKIGFDIGESETPIVPVMLGEAKLAQTFSKKLYQQGVFAMAIGYPTVPKGKTRIRVMNSAAHTVHHLKLALSAFENVGSELGIIH